MYSTLDILLMSDPFSGSDRTDEWENQIDQRVGPKLKFPIKLREESLDDLNQEFKDPNVPTPVKKKKGISKASKTVEVGKKKDNKSKLF
jgi:hypothetical protein